MDKESFGGFVAALRKEQGLTQKDLAEKLNLTDKAISKWERGLSYPDISMLEPLADTLQVSVLELLKGERIPSQEMFTFAEAKEMFQDSLNISDAEISRKHTKNKIIILSGCVILMLFISILLNIRNYMSDRESPSNQPALSNELDVEDIMQDENSLKKEEQK